MKDVGWVELGETQQKPGDRFKMPFRKPCRQKYSGHLKLIRPEMLGFVPQPNLRGYAAAFFVIAGRAGIARHRVRLKTSEP